MKFKAVTMAVGMVLVASSSQVSSQPWIDTEDAYLRSSVQQLVALGVVKRPVNTYPLMWQGIVADLENIEPEQVPKKGQFAFLHLKHALKFASQTTTHGFKLSANSEPNSMQSFGEQLFHQAAFQTYSSITGDKVSAKISARTTNEAINGQSLQFDGSYLAVLFGNWSLSAEQVNYWWGPGLDSSLLLSNNTSAFPALRLSRLNTDYQGPSWLSFIGNWNFTMMNGWLEHSPHTAQVSTPAIKRSLFWGSRISATPLDGLELGLSHTALWGGESIDDTKNDLKDLLLWRSTDPTRTHHLGGFDVKYSDTIADQPLSVYAEFANQKHSKISPNSPAKLIGAETYFADSGWLNQWFIEYKENNCEAVNACIYSHAHFGQNYSRYGRNLADNSSSVTTHNHQTWVLGTNIHMLGGEAAYFKVRSISIKGSNRQENQQQISDFKQLQFELGYQREVLKGKFSASAIIVDNKPNDNEKLFVIQADNGFKVSWERRF